MTDFMRRTVLAETGTPRAYRLTGLYRDHCVVGGCASSADEWVTIAIDHPSGSVDLDIPVCKTDADLLWPERVFDR